MAWTTATMLGGAVWYKAPTHPDVLEAQAKADDDDCQVLPGRPYFLIRDTLDAMGRHTRANFEEVFRWMYGRDPTPTDGA